MKSFEDIVNYINLSLLYPYDVKFMIKQINEKACKSTSDVKEVEDIILLTFILHKSKINREVLDRIEDWALPVDDSLPVEIQHCILFLYHCLIKAEELKRNWQNENTSYIAYNQDPTY